MRNIRIGRRVSTSFARRCYAVRGDILSGKIVFAVLRHFKKAKPVVEMNSCTFNAQTARQVSGKERS